MRATRSSAPSARAGSQPTPAVSRDQGEKRHATLAAQRQGRLHPQTLVEAGGGGGLQHHPFASAGIPCQHWALSGEHNEYKQNMG